MKVLITDCFTRKAFDIYNILNRYYKRSEIICSSDKNNAKKGRLIYHQKTIALRKNSSDDFIDDLLIISNTYSKELIIYLPIEEDTTVLFYSFIEKLGSRNFLYQLPSFGSFSLARDKYLLNKFCIENKIPAPGFFEYSEVLTLNKDFIPLILKPRHGSGAKGIKYVNNINQFKKLDIDFANFVIQEKLPNGKDVKGAFFLCNNGEIISSYGHERIRTFPVDGGVTTYSKFYLNKEIKEIGTRLLRKLNWTGFAMLEFLWDERSKNYKVIEINPRLWGSVLLSEFSGLGFIRNYINLCLKKPLTELKIKPYVKIRWMPFEFFNLIHSRGKIKDFWKINRKETCYINFTYANWWSIFWFHLFFYLNLSNFKTLLKKWKK